MTTTKKILFSFRMNPTLKADIDNLSRMTDRSMGYIASQAIQEYVDRKKWQMEAIEEALMDVEKGEFISHEAMCAWMTSLTTDNQLPEPKPDVFRKVSSLT